MTPNEIRLRFPDWDVFDDGAAPTARKRRTSPALRVVRGDWDALAREMGRAEMLGAGGWWRQELEYREAQHRDS